MTYQKKTAPDGTEYVTITHESVVNVGLLRSNLARFRAEESAWRRKAEETEAMIVEVEKIAPDLLIRETKKQRELEERQLKAQLQASGNLPSPEPKQEPEDSPSAN